MNYKKKKKKKIYKASHSWMASSLPRESPAAASPSRRLTLSSSPSQAKTPTELLLSVQSVVKNIQGSVLARQLILKSDHFDTAVNTRLDFSLHGAPNVCTRFPLCVCIYGVSTTRLSERDWQGPQGQESLVSLSNTVSFSHIYTHTLSLYLFKNSKKSMRILISLLH